MEKELSEKSEDNLEKKEKFEQPVNKVLVLKTE